MSSMVFPADKAERNSSVFCLKSLSESEEIEGSKAFMPAMVSSRRFNSRSFFVPIIFLKKSNIFYFIEFLAFLCKSYSIGQELQRGGFLHSSLPTLTIRA